MADEMIAELEQAARIVMAPPNVVGPEQRQAAEQIFVSFHRTKMPYNLCRHILEKCANGYVLFHVAQTIREAVLREWALLPSDDVTALRNFLLHYVTQNVNLEGYVRDQMLQAVAVMVKRGTVDSSSEDRDRLFQDVTQLITSQNLSMQLIACSILSALLYEYSTTSRSSNLGLTWEFHSRCKRLFEKGDLKRVFAFCLQMLGELEHSPSPLQRESVVVLNRFLSILDQVLCWTYQPKDLPRKWIGAFMGGHSVSFKPPASWRDMVLDKGLIDLLFRIHRKVRHNSEMAHHSLQCLSQLASINGTVFENDEHRTAFLTHYITAFLDLVSCSGLQDYEALGVATIAGNLLLFFPLVTFLTLQTSLLQAFIHSLTQLTCNFCQQAAKEEAMHREDTLYQEAYEKLLDSWMTFTSSKTMEDNAPTESYKTIFNTYLQSHLAAPDGTRDADALGQSEEDEYDEIEEDDRDRFKDQLSNVGQIARQVPAHAIPLLTRLLEERVGRLHGQLSRIQQVSSASGDVGLEDNSIANAINEDLHWLLLVTGHILTEECPGETPVIPAAIMTYAIAQTQQVDLAMTLSVLSSPGSQVSSIPGADTTTDPVVRLVAAILRLCEVEKRAIEARLTAYLSPQVCSSCVWLLRRWVLSYLLPDEEYYTEISKTLLAAFGRDTEGAQWTIGFLLDKITSNMAAWSSEEGVITDTLQLLVSMVEKKVRCDYVVKCETLWNIASAVSVNQSPYDLLSSPAKRLLYKGLVLAGGATLEGDVQEKYWKLVLSQVSERLQVLAEEDRLRKAYSQEPVRAEVISLLETVCGITEATRVNTVDFLFKLIQPSLTHAAIIIDIYHNYDEVVQGVLEMFHTVANRQILYLKPENASQFYSASLSMIQVYAKHNIGRQALSALVEEERSSGLLTLMQLFNNLVVKEFIDFGWTSDAEAAQTVSAVDVMFVGLNIIVPLMNEEVLKLPALCTSYFYLLSSAADFPEKLCSVSPELFRAIMTSTELGLGNFGSDITKFTLEFLTLVATYAYSNELPELQQTLAHFLKRVLHMLLLESFDLDLLEVASTALYSLICCNKTTYQSVVSELISQHSEHAGRLTALFTALTPPQSTLALDRRSKILFNGKFETFLTDARSFLCVR